MIMKTLQASLKDSEDAVLTAIAQHWGVDASKLNPDELPAALEAAMLDPQRAEKTWDKLSDEQRGSLQTLLGFNDGKMPATMFTRLHGEIRKMGKGAVEREKPQNNPASKAEALFYRGYIFQTYEQGSAGLTPIVYIPQDFVAVLPSHKTGYDDIEAPAPEGDPAATPAELEALPEDYLEEVQPADTTIVDDMTSLLAYLQVVHGTVENGYLVEHDRAAIAQHFITPGDIRVQFLFGIGISADLIEIQENTAYPKRAEVRRWLEARRGDQLRTLAFAWRDSVDYRDLWHIPGLYPEPGWSYDPVVPRKVVIDFLNNYAPEQGWWSIEDFIVAIKTLSPDFQRPNGDYDSWYIRNESGDYLRGFESWDAVEGALLEYYCLGPLHWLGLVDSAEDAARLTAYGRLFLKAATNWPSPPEQENTVEVQGDGTIVISRRANRFDRFQAMRFTDWLEANTEGHIYKLTGDSIRRAGNQGIKTEHIEAFIKRMTGEVPPVVAQLLNTWEQGAATSITLQPMMVLRTTSPETLDFILQEPKLRRFIRARLGEMAAAVQADRVDELREVLGAQGIQADVLE